MLVLTLPLVLRFSTETLCMDQVWILAYGYEGQTLGERFSLLRIAQNVSMPLPRVCQIWVVFLTKTCRTI
jgi:hypothetical protein